MHFARHDCLMNNSRQTIYAFLLQLPMCNIFFYICSLHQFSSHPQYHPCCSHTIFQPPSVVFFFLVSTLKLKHKHNLNEVWHIKKSVSKVFEMYTTTDSTVHDFHFNIQFRCKRPALVQKYLPEGFLVRFLTCLLFCLPPSASAILFWFLNSLEFLYRESCIVA